VTHVRNEKAAIRKTAVVLAPKIGKKLTAQVHLRHLSLFVFEKKKSLNDLSSHAKNRDRSKQFPRFLFAFSSA
jgi:hypothetical protein